MYPPASFIFGMNLNPPVASMIGRTKLNVAVNALGTAHLQFSLPSMEARSLPSRDTPDP